MSETHQTARWEADDAEDLKDTVDSKAWSKRRGELEI
jgi:hypothetical protein